jgi:hypothetical protein
MYGPFDDCTKVKGTTLELNRVVELMSQVRKQGITLPIPWPWAIYGTGKKRWVEADLRILQLRELLEEN